jgi:hypothetical protein
VASKSISACDSRLTCLFSILYAYIVRILSQLCELSWLQYLHAATCLQLVAQIDHVFYLLYVTCNDWQFAVMCNWRSKYHYHYKKKKSKCNVKILLNPVCFIFLVLISISRIMQIFFSPMTGLVAGPIFPGSFFATVRRSVQGYALKLDGIE